jgi:phosphoribosyl 1,2-cyclic phosphodiesterase
MQVRFFGVRGSTPCHGEAVAKYGGNTSCVAVRVPGHGPLFIDLGTGARYMGVDEMHDGTFRGTCLLSHLHWDHTQGLPFFTPLHSVGSHLDVYAPTQDDGRPVAEVIAEVIKPPLFPIGVAQLPGTMHFRDTDDGEFMIGEIKVTARRIPHVGPTLGFRLEWQGHTIAYLSDHQQPHDGTMSISDAAREIAQGVDLLIHDSQYTNSEFALKSTWGHCTSDYALWVAEACRVRTLALFHHDPTRTDVDLDEMAVEARAAGERGGFEVFVAAEGMTVAVG